MNAMAFFSLYLYFIFTYFVVTFYIFPELTNHIREPKQWHRRFFLLFSAFLLSHATFDTLFGGKKAENVSAVATPRGCDWLVLKKVIK